MINPINSSSSMSDDLEAGIPNSPPTPSKARHHLQRLLSFTNHTRNAVTQRLTASLPQNDMERQFAKTAAYASAAVLSAAAYIDLSGKYGSPTGSSLALLSTLISFHYFGAQALYNGREAHGMRTYISSYNKEYPPPPPPYQDSSGNGDLLE